MENTAQVQKQLALLNGGPEGPWVAGIGFHSFMSFEPPLGDKDLVFKTNEGYAVKIFINTKTGEVKSYSATLFTDKVNK